MKICLTEIWQGLQFVEYLRQVYCDKKDILLVSLLYLRCNQEMHFCATNVRLELAPGQFFFFLVSGILSNMAQNQFVFSSHYVKSFKYCQSWFIFPVSSLNVSQYLPSIFKWLLKPNIKNPKLITFSNLQ